MVVTVCPPNQDKQWTKAPVTTSVPGPGLRPVRTLTCDDFGPQTEKSGQAVVRIDDDLEGVSPESSEEGEKTDEKTNVWSCELISVTVWAVRLLAIPVLLYVFICSLSLLTSAFRLLCGKMAGNVFSNSELLANPVTGLMIGILATVLVQSSSTSTSIVVSMVASGIIDVQNAIPIVMGANIGTSVTNTVVAMVQLKNRAEFKRAFAGATVHDMFNWLTVIILLPAEIASGYLYHLTKAIVFSGSLQMLKAKKKDMLKVITRPFTNLIVQVDKKAILKIAAGDVDYNKRLLRVYCRYEEVTILKNVTLTNTTVQDLMVETNTTEQIGTEKCFSIFSHLGLSDTMSGVILLILALTVLTSCLIAMVKVLNSMLKNQVATAIKKTVNADFPGRCSCLTGYVAILVGAGLTVLVQSSSVFTSTLTPLVGVGALHLERMFPLTLGSNIGTTGTAVLAALASSSDRLPTALQIALCHFFFNVSGILIFYPIPILRKLPLGLAKHLGKITATHRWFALFYLCLMFVLFPGFVFTLSLAGPTAVFIFMSVLSALVACIVLLKVLQRKCPQVLPKKLQTMEFLPKFLRSLGPYDTAIMSIVSKVKYHCFCSSREQSNKSQADSIITSPMPDIQSEDSCLLTEPIESSMSSKGSITSSDTQCSATSQTPLIISV